MNGKKGLGSDFAVDKVERELVHGILVGRYRPNDELPSIDRLCEAFGVGYQTVRSAVGRLTSRGLLSALPGACYRVVDIQSSIDLKLLFDIIAEAVDEPGRRWTLLAQTCGFLRFMLAEVADRAARYRDETQLEWLRHLIRLLTDRIALRVVREAVGECELQVWRVLAAASRCITHTAIVNSMRDFLLGDFLVEKNQPLVPIDDYWALMEAIANKDPDRACELMTTAIWRLEDHCIKELKKLGWSETPTGATPE